MQWLGTTKDGKKQPDDPRTGFWINRKLLLGLDLAKQAKRHNESESQKRFSRSRPTRETKADH